MIELAFATALLLAPQTPPAPQDRPASELEDVVVEGRSLRETVDRFVDDIVAPPVGRGPARWDRKVCVGVSNLRNDTAQALVDQISTVALRVGLEIGEPGCRANILVIASADGAALARGLVEVRPLAFRPPYAGAARGRAALERFQNREAAVRWWHVSVPVSSEDGSIAVRVPGLPTPAVRQDGSRLNTRIRNDLRRAIIILDMDRVGDTTVQQLGDYIGMVALAQIDPDAETGSYDTILNLFDGATRPDALTEWDASYLSSLYDAELNRRAPVQQSGEVSGIMFRDRDAAQRQDVRPAPSDQATPDDD